MDQYIFCQFFSIGALFLVHCFVYSVGPLLYFSIGPLVLVHCFISSIGENKAMGQWTPGGDKSMSHWTNTRGSMEKAKQWTNGH